MAKKPFLKIEGPRPPLGIVIDSTQTAIYVQVSSLAVAKTKELEDGVLADYDADGHLVGFELVGLGKNRVGRVFANIRADYEREAPNLAQLELLSVGT